MDAPAPGSLAAIRLEQKHEMLKACMHNYHLAERDCHCDIYPFGVHKFDYCRALVEARL